MNFVFLMDPLETVIFDKDSSFMLMLAAHRKGHRVFFLSDGKLTLENGHALFHLQEVVPQVIPDQPFVIKHDLILSEKDVDVIFVRSDPPFDGQYLMNTWLLDRLPKRIAVMNSPQGLRTVNEKVWATQFTSLVPPTLVGRNRSDLLSFIKKYKHVVGKPTDGHGGQSIFQIKQNDPNTNVILETLTQNFSRDIILQKFIPGSRKGDKRILLLNGEILGAILRVHGKSDYRNNLFAGGKPYPATVTARDRKIVSVLKPHLRRLGLYFVGIDILGDYLVEVNVTSPTCLQEMNRLYGWQLENKVVAFVEKLIKQKRK